MNSSGSVPDTKEKNYKKLKTIKTIVGHLNQKTGKNFKHSSEITKRKITARLNEGFSLDDFKKVIETKTREWVGDPKMNSFLRPETLFGSKFESYLNQVNDPKSPSGAGNKFFVTE